MKIASLKDAATAPWILLLASFSLAGSPASAAEKAPSPPAPESPGGAMLRQLFREEVQAIAARSLSGLDTREAWEKRRPQLRRELQEMLGLLPEPPRGDLKPVVTGILERPDLGIAVEKLHFQSLPGLYVTGNLYRPLKVEGKIPAILYLCGHGTVKIDGVAYGAKVNYQHHPTWFARKGFACLVIDTLQFGEIEGFHHGTYHLGMWWWVSRGYTPAGVEAWNSIRAIDYLAGRPEVDPGRIGVTGRSGGGIGTWWLAALDDRPAALVPVAGITDLENHVMTGCIEGHCDCNFPVNLYRWDYPTLAALAAPRPLLFSNSDKDRIFPLDGVLRVHAKLREIYRLLDVTDRLGLLITEGPHADTPELRLPAFRWMERWLRPPAEEETGLPAAKLFQAQELKVFRELPADQRNTTIHESFVPAAAAPEVPAGREAFDQLRSALLQKLQEKTFRNEPDPSAPLEVELLERTVRGGVLLRGFKFRSERAVRLTLLVASPVNARPARVVLRVIGEAGWKRWAGDTAFQAEAVRETVERNGWALAVLPPRGIGPTRFTAAPESLTKEEVERENHLRRRFLLLGRTLEGTRVHDVRRAIRVLTGDAETSAAPLWLESEGPMAAVALYAGLFEPRAAGFDLRSLPSSHRPGPGTEAAPPLLNVLRVLDLPQAAALVFPRPLHLQGVKPEDFEWTRRAAALFATANEGSPLKLNGS